MDISERGLALLRSFEGCELEAYPDGGGVWTIGYGHIEGVHSGMKISQAIADELLRQDAEAKVADVNRLIGAAPTTQCQFDALTCLIFNIGAGNPSHVPPIPGLATSTVLKRHKLRNYMGASNAFVMWNRDNGKIIPGLTRRRQAEARLYRGEPA